MICLHCECEDDLMLLNFPSHYGMHCESHRSECDHKKCKQKIFCIDDLTQDRETGFILCEEHYKPEIIEAMLQDEQDAWMTTREGESECP